MQGANQEQLMNPIYRYAFITDAEEGLIVTDIPTLHDREPRNNFLKRELTWNENGVLKGARHVAIAGNTFYVSADAGIVVLDMSDPLKPRHRGDRADRRTRSAAQVQFRYLFVTRRTACTSSTSRIRTSAREIASGSCRCAMRTSCTSRAPMPTSPTAPTASRSSM